MLSIRLWSSVPLLQYFNPKASLVLCHFERGHNQTCSLTFQINVDVAELEAAEKSLWSLSLGAMVVIFGTIELTGVPTRDNGD
jgi:hypothetical protein